jgi:hypothetical protein
MNVSGVNLIGAITNGRTPVFPFPFSGVTPISPSNTNVSFCNLPLIFSRLLSQLTSNWRVSRSVLSLLELKPLDRTLAQARCKTAFDRTRL